VTPLEIKETRQRLRMTQMELAAALGVSFATVNRWESGKAVPLPDRVERMKALRPRELDDDLVTRWTGRLILAIGEGTFRKEVAAMVKEIRAIKPEREKT
jgi:transcriptional regulator with XRE-family HTH domain